MHVLSGFVIYDECLLLAIENKELKLMTLVKVWFSSYVPHIRKNWDMYYSCITSNSYSYIE